jgi:hypothetical protein
MFYDSKDEYIAVQSVVQGENDITLQEPNAISSIHLAS